MAQARRPKEQTGGTHVEFADAKITTLTLKNNDAEIHLKGHIKNLAATRRELDNLGSGNFVAFVILEGDVQQEELGFEEEGNDAGKT